MSIGPTSALSILAVLAGAFIFGLLFMLATGFPSWGSDPRDPQAIRALLSGPNLAHWTCSADERQRFLQRELARLGRMLLRRLALAAAMGAGLLVLLLGVEQLRGSTLDATTTLAAVGVSAVVTGMFIGVAPQTNSYLNLHRLRARYGSSRDQADHEVTLSRTGAYLFGDYFRLQGGLVSVKRVTLEAGDPPSLVFETLTRRSRSAVTKELIVVPVASGAQAQAAALAQHFPGAG
jgi:hypothetical protein